MDLITFERSMKKPDLIVITGPTASGKTTLATNVAARLNGEVISADSRQVFKEMDIGTGKDLHDYEVKGKQIPYHLINIEDPGTEYSVFDFQRDFLNAFEQIKKQSKLPVLCGGTGMYIDSVLKGYRLLKVPENSNWRGEMKGKTDEELVLMLKELKPLHNTTDMKDRERLVRALEIAKYEKDHVEEVKDFPKINSLVFGVRYERKKLRERITNRLKERLDSGMIEEVEKLLETGLKPEQLKFYGLEYRYLTQYLTGELSYDEMFKGLNTAIHQFAKRQMTWFRRMERKGTEINWIEGEKPLGEKIDYISRKFKQY